MSPLKSGIVVLLLLIYATAGAAELSSGPMPAWSEMTGAAIWLQTKGPAAVQLRYWPDGSTTTSLLTPVVQTNPEKDFIALFELNSLWFGQRYAYEVYLDGIRQKFDAPLYFKTQPNWRFRRPAPDFEFAFGSCVYIDDPYFDRPGRPYGGDYSIFNTIAEASPAFMLWIGDNIYYREADWLTPAAMRNRWRSDRALPALQPLLRATQHYYIWDDHDFGPNDSDRSFRLRPTSLEVFADYCPSLTRGTPDTPGAYFKFEYADCAFFMLDDRYHRSPNRMPDGPEKEMFGRAQLQWLKEGLTSARAGFKFIISGNQVLNPITAYEGWGSFPTERNGFLKWLEDSNTTGVLFLSGDRHMSELIKLERAKAYTLYDFSSSPLTSSTNKMPRDLVNPARVKGTLVTQKKNFGLIRVSGPPQERKIRLMCRDVNQTELWNFDLTQLELGARARAD